MRLLKLSVVIIGVLALNACSNGKRASKKCDCPHWSQTQTVESVHLAA